MTETESRLKLDWKLLTGTIFLFTFGFTIYNGVFQNFLRDVMGAGPLDLGRLESLREIPGLLAALTAGALFALAESKVSTLGLLICAFGIGLSAEFDRYWSLVAITVFWSVGFHLHSAVASAMTLSLARGKEGGRHLGRMGAVGASATLAALLLAWTLSKLIPADRESYRYYFVIGAVAIIGAAICSSRLSNNANSAQRAPLIFRREYGLFYLLTFLEGCRRQIFSIFASFALILVYKVPLSHMLMLQLINAVLISLTAPHIGRLIDRRGERGPLTFYSIGLIAVFLGYATFQTVGALYALFVLDNILFSFGVGFTTYLHRIVRPDELTPCVSMGVTMNHVAAVTVPYFGAILWERTHDYQAPFWVGVFIAAVSLVATRWLPRSF